MMKPNESIRMTKTKEKLCKKKKKKNQNIDENATKERNRE